MFVCVCVCVRACVRAYLARIPGGCCVCVRVARNACTRCHAPNGRDNETDTDTDADTLRHTDADSRLQNRYKSRRGRDYNIFTKTVGALLPARILKGKPVSERVY
jgi:hypothetical protein